MKSIPNTFNHDKKKGQKKNYNQSLVNRVDSFSNFYSNISTDNILGVTSNRMPSIDESNLARSRDNIYQHIGYTLIIFVLIFIVP